MKYIAFEKSVGGVIYKQQDEKILFLMLRYRSGQWDFPKGHMEKNESEEQTLRREILEETNIGELSIFPKFRIAVNYFYSAKGKEKKERIREGRGIYIFKKVAYYLCRTTQEDVKIDFENTDYAWLEYQQAYDRISNDGSRKIIAAAQHAITSRKNA